MPVFSSWDIVNKSGWDDTSLTTTLSIGPGPGGGGSHYIAAVFVPTAGWPDWLNTLQPTSITVTVRCDTPVSASTSGVVALRSSTGTNLVSQSIDLSDGANHTVTLDTSTVPDWTQAMGILVDSGDTAHDEANNHAFTLVTSSIVTGVAPDDLQPRTLSWTPTSSTSIQDAGYVDAAFNFLPDSSMSIVANELHAAYLTLKAEAATSFSIIAEQFRVMTAPATSTMRLALQRTLTFLFGMPGEANSSIDDASLVGHPTAQPGSSSANVQSAAVKPVDALVPASSTTSFATGGRVVGAVVGSAASSTASFNASLNTFTLLPPPDPNADVIYVVSNG